MKTQTVAIFGLGRMGAQLARRLRAGGFNVVAWNRSPEPVLELCRGEERSTSSALRKGNKGGLFATTDLAQAVAALKDATPRIFWIMLPHGIVDDFIFGPGHVGPHLRRGDIVIDGGNSFYKDSMKRAARLARRGVVFFDSGTSGGVWGEKNGFALMVGGDRSKWPLVEPIFRALSSGPDGSGDNYAFLGKAGAGHFTKMVHNGIEYGMMEAIGEGYAVLEASPFKLNLRDVTRVYQKGSVVRSWLIDLCRNIFEHEDVQGTAGKIDATGEGEWTVNAGHEFGVDVRVIEDSLAVRRESADTKNQRKFSNKVVALLRKQFGGHAAYAKKQAPKRRPG